MDTGRTDRGTCCSTCDVRVAHVGERIAIGLRLICSALGGDMLKYFLVFSLALPLCGHGQSYVDSPFYKPISAIPSSAYAEYMPNGSIKANGIVIDLSEWRSAPLTSPDFDEIGGWQIQADVDRNGPVRVFQYYAQYNNLNVTFAYDLLAQPEGTDKIKCTFSALTDLALTDLTAHLLGPQQGHSRPCPSSRSDSTRDQIWRCNRNQDGPAR